MEVSIPHEIKAQAKITRANGDVEVIDIPAEQISTYLEPGQVQALLEEAKARQETTPSG